MNLQQSLQAANMRVAGLESKLRMLESQPRPTDQVLNTSCIKTLQDTQRESNGFSEQLKNANEENAKLRQQIEDIKKRLSGV